MLALQTTFNSLFTTQSIGLTFARVDTTHANCVGSLRQTVNPCAIETRFGKLRKFIFRLSRRLVVQGNETHSFLRRRPSQSGIMAERSTHVGVQPTCLHSVFPISPEKAISGGSYAACVPQAVPERHANPAISRIPDARCRTASLPWMS